MSAYGRVACNESRTPIGIDGVDQRAATVWIFSGEARCLDARLIERSCGVGRVTTGAEKQRNVETHRRRDDAYVGDIGRLGVLPGMSGSIRNPQVCM